MAVSQVGINWNPLSHVAAAAALCSSFCSNTDRSFIKTSERSSAHQMAAYAASLGSQVSGC